MNERPLYGVTDVRPSTKVYRYVRGDETHHRTLDDGDLVVVADAESLGFVFQGRSLCLIRLSDMTIHAPTNRHNEDVMLELCTNVQTDGRR